MPLNHFHETDAAKSLAGKTETGSHEYHIGGNYYAVRMGNGDWYVFEGKQGAGARDTGFDFKTLRACRQWAASKLEAV